MANRYDFVLPQGMEPARVAQTFAAYLMGAHAFGHTLHPNGLPCQISKRHWQLDGGNDFWLTVEGTTARIRCRYEDEEPVLDAMVTLFKERHWLTRDTRIAA